MEGPDKIIVQVEKLVHWVEALAAGFLALLSVIVLGFAVYELVVVFREPSLESFQGLISAILLVFVILELYSITVEFMKGGPVVEKVVEVGLVVLVRQVTAAEFLNLNVLNLFAIAALILALGLTRFFAGGGFAKPKNEKA